MDAETPWVNAGSMRERELEVEIARLKAELEFSAGVPNRRDRRSLRPWRPTLSISDRCCS